MKKLKPLVILLGLGAIFSFESLVFAQVNYDSIGNVTFTPYTGITPPVDPENPDEVVDPFPNPEPGTNGPLSIDFASSFNFGTHEISNLNQTYYAIPQLIKIEDLSVIDGYRFENRAKYIQVSDNRGTNAGWTLQVRQNGQFQNSSTQHDILHGAQITISDVNAISSANTLAPTTHEIILDPFGSLSNVMSAKNGEGAMTWVARFGAVTDELNKEVALFVPGSTPKDAVTYQTTLTWVLTDVPGL